jgi:hypothetical protein
MTNNKKEDKDYNLEFEESTKHRDNLAKQREGKGKVAKRLIKIINLAIKTYNGSIAKAASLISVDIKLQEVNENQTLNEIMESGAGSFSLGVVDDLVKGVRRMGLPALQAVNVFG